MASMKHNGLGLWQHTVSGEKVRGGVCSPHVAGLVVSSAAVIGFVAGTAAPVTQAQAQMRMGMGGGGGMGMGGAKISRQSLDAYARILKLDAEQKEAAKILAEGYRGTLADLEKDLEGRVRKLGARRRTRGSASSRRRCPR